MESPHLSSSNPHIGSASAMLALGRTCWQADRRPAGALFRRGEHTGVKDFATRDISPIRALRGGQIWLACLRPGVNESGRRLGWCKWAL